MPEQDSGSLTPPSDEGAERDQLEHLTSLRAVTALRKGEGRGAIQARSLLWPPEKQGPAGFSHSLKAADPCSPARSWEVMPNF